MYLREIHPLNASFSIYVSLRDKSMLVRAVQFSNAEVSICVILSGKSIKSKFLQPLKVPAGML